MKVDDYRLLVTLNKTKSLKQAAEELFISQPAVSQRLKSIETEWGVQIFIRTKRMLYVTPEGERIIDLARQVVYRETEIRNYLKSNTNEVSGVLSIGVSSIIGSTILPKIVRAFLQKYPGVNIKITVGSTPDIIEKSKEYHVSIIRGSKILHKVNERIKTDKHYFVTPKHHMDVEALSVIEFQADRLYLNEIEQYYVERYKQKYDPQIKVDQMITCKQLLLEGIGVTILPEVALNDLSHKDFHMEEVLVKGEPLTRDTYLSYDENVVLLPQVSAFKALINEFISE